MSTLQIKPAGVPQGIRDFGFYFGKPLYNMVLQEVFMPWD